MNKTSETLSASDSIGNELELCYSELETWIQNECVSDNQTANGNPVVSEKVAKDIFGSYMYLMIMRIVIALRKDMKGCIYALMRSALKNISRKRI